MVTVYPANSNGTVDYSQATAIRINNAQGALEVISGRAVDGEVVAIYAAGSWDRAEVIKDGS